MTIHSAERAKTLLHLLDLLLQIYINMTF
jgi:hypothetical protein